MTYVHSFNPDDIDITNPFENALVLISDFANQFEFFKEKHIELCPPGIFSQLKHMVDSVSCYVAKLKKAYIHNRYLPDIKYVSTLSEYIQKVKSIKNYIRFCNTNSAKRVNLPLTYSSKSNFYRIKSSFIALKNELQLIIDNEKTYFSYSQNMWPQNDVLVGSLRNTKQLNIAIKHNFYHIPKYLVEDPGKIKCIAIYQSKNLFDIDSGIKYYGRVIGFSEVERYRIKEVPSKSDEFYVKFEIDSWRMLKTPIIADYIGDTCIFTSLFQLMQCKKSSELLLSGKSEFDLYMFMKKNAFTKQYECFRYMDKDVIYNNNVFEIYQDQKCILKISSEHFARKGVSAVKIIPVQHSKSNLDLNAPV